MSYRRAESPPFHVELKLAKMSVGAQAARDQDAADAMAAKVKYHGECKTCGKPVFATAAEVAGLNGECKRCPWARANGIGE